MKSNKGVLYKRNALLAWLLSFLVVSIIGPATAQEVPPPEATPGTLQFGQTNFTVAENAGQATITVTRTGGSDGSASVQVSTSDGTASAGQDYEAVSTTLTWADGDDAPKSFSVQILDNSTPEPNKTVSLNLSSVSGAALGTPSAATLVPSSRGTPTPMRLD